ncbi:hypothetical protein [Pseudomonas hunanensis]|uniref:hypothetical protein n=1 Tax=Pseudomonas hunanensis TaxID=1247546 RepID=UPI0030D87F0F
MLQADHIVRLPAVDNQGKHIHIDVHFVEMTTELVNVWQATVQCEIDQTYSRFPTPSKAARVVQPPRKAKGLSVVSGAMPNSGPQDVEQVKKVVTHDLEMVVENAGLELDRVMAVAEAAACEHLGQRLDCAVGSDLATSNSDENSAARNQPNLPNATPSVTQAVLNQPAAANQASANPIRYRADVNWSWSSRFVMHRVNSWLCQLNSKGGESKAICMVVRKGGREIPIGMLTLVPSFTCKIFGLKKPRAYTWYLADAPREFYSRALGLKKITNVARALLDYTVQVGIEANQETTLVLRADTGGGQRLKDYYQGIGMTPLPDDHPVISPARLLARKGYFKLRPEHSKEFCSVMDVYRAPRHQTLSSVEHA